MVLSCSGDIKFKTVYTHREIKINTIKLYNCHYNISPAALSVMKKEGYVGGNVSSAS